MFPSSSSSTSSSSSPSSSSPQTGFSRFKLGPSLQRGVAAAGFSEPRPIQEKTIPAVLEGRDVLGLAQTGTGKTAAFALPILERLFLEKRPGPRVLILVPTRELANQIEVEIRLLGKFVGVRTATVYGGVSMGRQIEALRRRPDIIIACPGRLLDLMGQGAARLDSIETLVLDEADHLFDMGFIPDVRKILSALPAKRQNLLFSATMPSEIRHLASRILANPHVVELAHSRPAETIEHALYPVGEGRKLDLLKHLLSAEDFGTAIVFTRTKHRAKRMAEQLDRLGHQAVALQGNMSQGQRDRAMADFRSGRAKILVATDIAARGIDVAGISHVINFDVPSTPDAYTHRIGRTGRAERQGKACTFVTGEDRDLVRAIERKIGAPIPRLNLPEFQTAAPPRADGPSSQRSFGGRREPERPWRNNPFKQDRSHGREDSRGGRGGFRRDDRPQERDQGSPGPRNWESNFRSDDRRPQGQRFENRSSEGHRPQGQHQEGQRFGGRPSEGRPQHRQGGRPGGWAPRSNGNRRSHGRGGRG